MDIEQLAILHAPTMRKYDSFDKWARVHLRAVDTNDYFKKAFKFICQGGLMPEPAPGGLMPGPAPVEPAPEPKPAPEAEPKKKPRARKNKAAKAAK